MLSPSSLSSSNVFVAKRTSICLSDRLPRSALLGLSMFSVYVNMDTLVTSFTFLILILLNTFVDQMTIQGRDLNDLAAGVAVGEHKTRNHIVEIKLL